MGNAIDWLIAQGVDVVSYSMGWVNTGPGDGTGPICEMVDQARAAGILWSNSAGNQAQRHWQGDWQDTDGDNWNDFNLDPFDETNAIWASNGDLIAVFLKWDDPWGASSNDYDLYLFDSTLNPVAYSINKQNGNDDPVESLVYTATYTGYYHIAIDKYLAAEAVNFHLYTFYQNLQYQVPSRSLLEPADSPSAVTVGAIYWNNPDILESFSSQGPTVDGRTKPDTVAPDGVSTATYGAGAFYGTSASAPHAAGAAALVKERYPSYTPAQIQAFLEERAVDLGDAGKDNLYGSGRLVLGAPNQPPTAPVIDVTPDSPLTTDDLTCSITTPSTDPDGDTVTYAYAWYKDAALQPELTTNTVSSSNTAKGEVWKCVLTPNDGFVDGLTGEDQVVIGNSPPTMDSVEIALDPAYTNTDLTAVPSGWSDPDNDPEGYQWQWQKWSGSTWEDILGATSDTLDSSNFVRGDQIKVICTPFDGEAAGTPVENTITIQNSLPVLSDGAVDPATGGMTDVFTYSVVYTDADNDAPAPITLTIDGIPHSMSVRAGQDGDFANSEVYEYTIGGADLGKGSHTFQFAARDGIDDAIGDTILHYAPGVDNTPPTLSGGTVSPADGHVTTTFTYTVTYTDEDNDGPMSITVTIDGTPHGMSVQAGQDGDFANGEVYEHNAAGLVKDIEHTFQFTASDGVDDAVGDTGVHRGLTVMNSAPTVDSVAITPDPAHTETDLTAVPSGWSDPDGDPEGYQWQWQKWSGSTWEDIPGATSNTLASSIFVRGDQIKVICTPFDGLDAGNPVENDITISNSPPTADAGPDQNKNVNTLVALDGSGSSDPDADPLTYAWTQTDGPTVTLSDPTAINPTFTPTEVGTYGFSLVVNDGALNSAPDMVVITVTRPSGGGGGGSGGGAPSTPKIKVEIIDKIASASTTKEGMLKTALEVTSLNGTVTLRLPQGTRALNSKGAPLDSITVVPVSASPEPPAKAHIIGVACYFKPEGTTFEPPIELVVTYDPEALPEGVNEEDLVIACYDTESGEWELLPSLVDPGAHTVGTSISHFTIFAIIGREEAAFDFANLSVSPSLVDRGESVTITVEVTNSGGMGGSHTVMLLIDGVEETRHELTLGPGASDTVTFAVTREDAGTHSVEIDGLTSEFTVKAHPFPWALVSGIIGGVLGLLAVVAITLYLVVFHRRTAPA